MLKSVSNYRVEKMIQDNINFKNQKNMNILHLIKKSKLEQKKEKRHTVYLAAVAFSALAISGYIISQ